MAKARRRAGISVLIMLIGFMTIAGVIVYRLSGMTSGSEARYGMESASVPAGADVLSAVASEGMLTLTYRDDNGVSIRIFDGASGELVREIAVVAE